MKSLFPSNQTANSSGKQTEQIIEAACNVLRDKGYIVAPQHPYNGKVLDLFIRGIDQYPHGLAISIKNQDVAGTADHKLLYEVDVLDTDIRVPAILLLSGDGFDKRVVNRVKLRTQERYRSVTIMRMDEFFAMLKRLPKCKDKNAQTRFEPIPQGDYQQETLL
jgi:hypothetical protein